MSIDFFIRKYNIQAADAIVVKKLNFGLLKHYIIYLGFHDGEHRFMANYSQGIKLISYQELSKFLNVYAPVEINRFRGNKIQRFEALNRAWSRKGEQEYDLILNNCEHYKNFVHHGRPKSDQVQAFGTGLLATGAVIAASSASNKNNDGAIGGLVIAGLGLLTLFMEND